MEIEIKLTSFSKGSGCGCKIAPSVLEEILKTTDVLPSDAKLIVGIDNKDDAAVYEIGNDQYLISTTDFFMPVVDDAYLFGKIAATNALSDVYAMGGKPILALAILGWPVAQISPELAKKVLEGARFICRMAGISLAGGHSIESAEPIFGLSVNGIVSKGQLKKNDSAKPGDLLFITKPLGVGIITTAAKRGVVLQEDLDVCISYMTTLNKIGEVLGHCEGVTALTDVTGFGLAGHLIEMCEASQCSAILDFEAIPVFPFLSRYLDQFIYPDMTTKNFAFYSNKMTELDAKQLFTMCDPQTSGGLLVAVSPETKDEYLQMVKDHGLQGIADHNIGIMTEKNEKVIRLSGSM